MGNTNSIPVISQVKSLVQFAGGDSAGALATQEDFAYRNTFPVVSQIASAGYAIGGEMDKARDLQEKFAMDMERVINTIPVAGHIKGGVHYALGQEEEGEEAMKAASRSTGVVLGGIGGFVAGGPPGAVAGGIAGGVVADGIITGSDIVAKGKDGAKPYGYIAVGHEIANAAQGNEKITIEEGFDMALLPVGDGVGGYSGGRLIGKPLGLKPGTVAKITGKEVSVNAVDDVVLKPKSGVVPKQIPPNQLSVLEQQLLDNKANQLNPNHIKSGPGRPAGYKGIASKADLDNHANQLNPNNLAYEQSRIGNIEPINA